MSDRVEARLVEFLGNPATSPYGNPIPGSGNDGAEISPIADVADGDFKLHSISESLQADGEVIRILFEHGMKAGEVVTVTHGPEVVELELDEHQVELSKDAAKLVYVVPA